MSTNHDVWKYIKLGNISEIKVMHGLLKQKEVLYLEILNQDERQIYVQYVETFSRVCDQLVIDVNNSTGITAHDPDTFENLIFIIERIKMLELDGLYLCQCLIDGVASK